MRNFLLIIVAFAAFSLTSCKKAPKLLTAEEISRQTDSLYTSTIATLGPQLDEMCQSQMDALVTAKADSIVTARAAEMATTKK
ncbi:MAG: hypothetical protein KA974_06245 [Saprospiraceae bacterium]|nr:hypothetical protein [Saprospiraceae bacterium]MBP7699307.1 hypothetical protein [Saprospiraceae bacterium]